MKVAILTASVSRDSGGVGVAVRGLAGGLGEAGVDVGIYTSGDRGESGDAGITRFPARGPAAFRYMPGLCRAVRNARPDLIHGHGLWMHPSLVAGRALDGAAPRIVSPHGMLDAWALGNACWKKGLARVLYEDSNLRRADCLHALCDAERVSMRRFGLANPIAVIPNGVDLPTPPERLPQWKRESRADARALLYLGRLHEKKGLPDLFRAFAALGAESDAKPWRLIVAGWGRDEDETTLRGLATNLRIEDRVRFVGPQFGEDKAATFAAADAFILPSKSEGLPMSVLEAWGYGLPVLMTAACNLPEGFASGAAVEIGPSTAEIAKGLQTFFAMSGDARRDMGERGKALVERAFAWTTAAARMRDLYDWVLCGGAAPGFVDFAPAARGVR